MDRQTYQNTRATLLAKKSRDVPSRAKIIDTFTAHPGTAGRVASSRGSPRATVQINKYRREMGPGMTYDFLSTLACNISLLETVNVM